MAVVIWNLFRVSLFLFTDICQSVISHHMLHLVCGGRGNMKRIYSRLLFLVFSPDINECMLSPPVCEQICTDTAGSFMCDCNTGFVLQSDESSCMGEYSSVYR